MFKLFSKSINKGNIELFDNDNDDGGEDNDAKDEEYESMMMMHKAVV